MKNSAHDFNKWMANMGNIHYSDDDKMAKAFKIIEDNEKV
jgi:hypothetical protein|tara:strand:- start:745 stop:864 length:120 start_codon:yes stop_codon:yes gene_type:complete